MLRSLDYQISILGHPTAYMIPLTIVGNGTIIGFNTSIMARTIVGQAYIESAGAIIDQDVRIRRYLNVNSESTVVAKSFVNYGHKIFANLFMTRIVSKDSND